MTSQAFLRQRGCGCSWASRRAAPARHRPAGSESSPARMHVCLQVRLTLRGYLVQLTKNHPAETPSRHITRRSIGAEAGMNCSLVLMLLFVGSGRRTSAPQLTQGTAPARAASPQCPAQQGLCPHAKTAGGLEMMQGQKAPQGDPDVSERGARLARNPFHRLAPRCILCEAGPPKIVPGNFTATMITHRGLGLVPYAIRRQILSIPTWVYLFHTPPAGCGVERLSPPEPTRSERVCGCQRCARGAWVPMQALRRRAPSPVAHPTAGWRACVRTGRRCWRAYRSSSASTWSCTLERRRLPSGCWSDRLAKRLPAPSTTYTAPVPSTCKFFRRTPMAVFSSRPSRDGAASVRRCPISGPSGRGRHNENTPPPPGARLRQEPWPRRTCTWHTFPAGPDRAHRTRGGLWGPAGAATR